MVLLTTQESVANIHRTLNNALVGATKQNENLMLEQREFDSSVLGPITNCLATMCKNNPSFSLTCRIFKRWLSVQMIGHYFEDITCDLIVAYAFEHFNTSYPQPR